VARVKWPAAKVARLNAHHGLLKVQYRRFFRDDAVEEDEEEEEEKGHTRMVL